MIVVRVEDRTGEERAVCLDIVGMIYNADNNRRGRGKVKTAGKNTTTTDRPTEEEEKRHFFFFKEKGDRMKL